MSKTEEQIKADLARNEEMKKKAMEIKAHKENLRADIELLRLEDEHFRLRRNIYENQMFFKQIEYNNMIQELSRHNNIPIEEMKKKPVDEINKLVVEYQREMQEKEAKKEAEDKLKLTTDKGDAPADSEEETIKENTGVTS